MSSSLGAWPPGVSGQTVLFSAPAPGPEKGPAWASSTSVMFLLYLVIGFSATLALILLLLSIYYTSRCLCRNRRRAAQDPETSEASMMLTPKELFLVLNPGGAATVAYREDEKQSMMPKNKTIQVKSVVIHIEATSMTADTLIPAYRSCSPSLAARSLPGAGEGQLVDESATSSSLEPCRQIDHAGVDGDQEQAERGTQQEAGPSTSAIQTAVSIAERELPAPDGSQLHIQNDDPNASQHKTYYINALFMQSPRDVEQS